MEIALWIDTPALGDTIAAIPTLRKISNTYGGPITVFTTIPSMFEGHPCVKQALHSDEDKSNYKVYRTFSPLVGATYDLKGEKVEFRHSNSEIRQFHAMSLGFNLTEDEMETDLYVEEPLELEVKDYVIIHPTHTWPTRTWEREKWQQLVDQLNDRGIPVVAIGHDSKEVGFFSVQKPVMDINIRLGVNLLNSPKTTIAALRWMMNHRAKAVVTMDSGILHVAGTTDVQIIQLGSSIDPKLRAPYRHGSQSYKYSYIAGGCGLFCSSNMAYNVKVHGSIHGVPPQIECLENKEVMDCKPEVAPVFNEVCKQYDVRAKIRLVHLLLTDDHTPERQQRSIDSISQLKDRGIEYIQIWNERWKDEAPRDTFEYPGEYDLVPIRPGHYGNYRAFVDAGMQYFTDDIDALIFAEGDSFLIKPIDEVVEDINRAYEACELHNLSYFSFGSRYSLHDKNELISQTRYKIDDIHVVNKVIGAQLVMLHNRVQYYCSDRFVHQKWTAADIYLNNLFMGKFNIGIFDQPVALQADGFSAIDEYEKLHADQRARNGNRFKLLFLAPHLSTGGMPEFLLGRLKALIDEPNLEIHVVEFTKYADTYTVQRDQIQKLLGDRFHEIAHLNAITSNERESRLQALIQLIQPDVIHIEESPEAFDGFNKMSAECQTWLYRTDQPWKIVETCHNIWFNPREGKRISPDAYLFVTPHHTLQTFSDEPSEKFEAFYPIIPRTKSESRRRKSLEILGLQHLADAKHIINIGLWTQGKNQAEALQWARQLQEQYPGQYQFHFIGNQAPNFQAYWGPLMLDLPPNVHIWGERNDIDTFYQLADAVAFNSTWECNPLAVRQALGYPLPVIARNLPQYHSMYEGQLTEIQADGADPLRLVEVLKNPAARKQNRKALQQFKQEHLDAYNSLLQKPVNRTPHTREDYTIRWQNGPTVQSLVDRPLQVKFWDGDQLVHQHTLEGRGHWTRPLDEWYRPWRVEVDGQSQTLHLEGEAVVVQFQSSSLGDTLSWVEPVVEFRRQQGLKKVYLATHKNWLFDKDYYQAQGIEFIAPGEWPQDAIAGWHIGVHMQDPPGQAWFPHRNKRDWRKIYLGDIATDQLGIDSVKRPPRLAFKGQHQQSKPYVCIATQSTAQCKYWNNPTGWQDLINYWNHRGYDVYHLSKEGTGLQGIIQAPEALEEVYKLLQGAQRFYGISSGLSWFAWATQVPITIISGFTPEECEFQDNRTIRIINKSVCNSCWAWDHFNRGDWNWCPSHKGTQRQFECSKLITVEDVLAAEGIEMQTQIEA